jgi:hypothetical protein
LNALGNKVKVACAFLLDAVKVAILVHLAVEIAQLCGNLSLWEAATSSTAICLQVVRVRFIAEHVVTHAVTLLATSAIVGFADDLCFRPEESRTCSTLSWEVACFVHVVGFSLRCAANARRATFGNGAVCNKEGVHTTGCLWHA